MTVQVGAGNIQAPSTDWRSKTNPTCEGIKMVGWNLSGLPFMLGPGTPCLGFETGPLALEIAL